MNKHKRDRMRTVISISIYTVVLAFAIIMLFVGCKKEAEAQSATANQPTFTSQGVISANTPASEQSIEEIVYYYSKEYGVDYRLACAVITVESAWQEDAENGSCVGLMQLNTDYEEYFKDGAGVYDLTDPRQNVKAGIWHLSVLQERYGDLNFVLMAWNLGEARALELWEQGITETEYTEKVRGAM